MAADAVEFQTIAHLERYWAKHPGAPVWACLVEMFAYPSFLTEIVLRRVGDGVRLEVEHRSYAMDMYGDATHVAVHYEVASTEAALAWLHRRFLHTIADCRTEPHPMPEDYPFMAGGARGQVRRYQAAWRRLREDFRKGRLLDKKLRVVHRFDGF
jgi:hypothetical protein